MEILFLGTGTSQGVPVIGCPCSVCSSSDPHDKRLRTSALVIDSGDNNILIDIGPDFRMQMLTNNIRHIEGILITHAHRDHIGGLDDIRPFNWAQKQNMDLYGNSIALEAIKNDFHYVFEPHQYPGLPEATLHDVSDCKPFRIGATTVTPVNGMHKDLPILGYRLDDDQGKKLAYLTDMNFINADELQKLQGLDVLVINALRKKKHYSHFSLAEALEVVASCNPKQCFLTHISHEMGRYSDVEQELPPNVHLSFDNLRYRIANHKSLLP